MRRLDGVIAPGLLPVNFTRPGLLRPSGARRVVLAIMTGRPSLHCSVPAIHSSARDESGVSGFLKRGNVARRRGRSQLGLVLPSAPVGCAWGSAKVLQTRAEEGYEVRRKYFVNLGPRRILTSETINNMLRVELLLALPARPLILTLNLGITIIRVNIVYRFGSELSGSAWAGCNWNGSWTR